MVNVAIALAIVLLLVAARPLYFAWRHRVRTEWPPHPRVPEHIVDGADRTWIVFTTPYCATCGPVADSLRANDPDARHIKIDATEQPGLAHAFSVRMAPTVLLANGEGAVQERLVGAAAVRDFVSARQ